jgi:hypothetical protein
VVLAERLIDEVPILVAVEIVITGVAGSFRAGWAVAVFVSVVVILGVRLDFVWPCRRKHKNESLAVGAGCP